MIRAADEAASRPTTSSQPSSRLLDSAVIGFAGQRVIKQTIGQDLPEGFQTAEFLLEKGQIDMVVPRASLRDTTSRLLRHMLGQKALPVASDN